MRIVAIDFETDLISEEAPIPAPVCLSWATPDGKSGLEVGMTAMEKYLKKILISTEHKIVAHNLKFELLVIYQHFPELRHRLWELLENVTYPQLHCTLIYDKLIENCNKNPQKKFALDILVKKYFNEDISEGKHGEDSWRLRYSELRDVPATRWPSEAVDYAIEDSIWALKIYAHQKSLNMHLKQLEHIQADFALNLMATTGIMVDQTRVQQLDKEINEICAESQQYLIKQGYISIDKKGKFHTNMKKLKEYVAENYPNPFYSKTKQISLRGEHLERYLAVKDTEVLRKFLFLVGYKKIQTGFIPRLASANPTLRTQYNTPIHSGRTSSTASSSYPSVNIQQIPRGLEGVTWDPRACFVPRPGYEMVSIDYAGLELAAAANQLAIESRNPQMAAVLNSGEAPTDMHSQLAASIMSIQYNKIVTYNEFVIHKKEAEYKKFRQIAKPINLGFPGGIGYDTMRTILYNDGILTDYEVITRFESEREARNVLYALRNDSDCLRVTQTGAKEWSIVYDELVRFKRALFNLYPDLEWFLKEGHQRYKTHGKIATLNDWGQWELEDTYAVNTNGFRREYCTYTALCNNLLMQTPAAVGAKAAMYRIIKEFYGTKQLIPLAFIHDEVIFEVRKNDTNKYVLIDRVAEILIDSMQKVLPKVRITAEASLMDYWSKSGGKWEAQYWRNVGSTELKKVIL